MTSRILPTALVLAFAATLFTIGLIAFDKQDADRYVDNANTVQAQIREEAAARLNEINDAIADDRAFIQQRRKQQDSLVTGSGGAAARCGFAQRNRRLNPAGYSTVTAVVGSTPTRIPESVASESFETQPCRSPVCTPPATWRSVRSIPPLDAPVRFGSADRTGMWTWLKDGESGTPCTAVEEARLRRISAEHADSYRRACDVAIGEPLFRNMQFQVPRAVRSSSFASQSVTGEFAVTVAPIFVNVREGPRLYPWADAKQGDTAIFELLADDRVIVSRIVTLDGPPNPPDGFRVQATILASEFDGRAVNARMRRASWHGKGPMPEWARQINAHEMAVTIGDDPCCAIAPPVATAADAVALITTAVSQPAPTYTAYVVTGHPRKCYGVLLSPTRCWGAWHSPSNSAFIAVWMPTADVERMIVVFGGVPPSPIAGWYEAEVRHSAEWVVLPVLASYFEPFRGWPNPAEIIEVKAIERGSRAVGRLWEPGVGEVLLSRVNVNLLPSMQWGGVRPW